MDLPQPVLTAMCDRFCEENIATLEELSLAQADNNVISFNGLIALKFMPKLKILNLLYNDGLEVEEWNLRRNLPHLMINLSSE